MSVMTAEFIGTGGIGCADAGEGTSEFPPLVSVKHGYQLRVQTGERGD